MSNSEEYLVSRLTVILMKLLEGLRIKIIDWHNDRGNKMNLPKGIIIWLTGRRMEKTILLQKHLDEMYKTKDYLIKNIVSVEEF